MKRPLPLLDRLAALLDGQRTKQSHGARHLPTCRIGQWVDGHQGAPCSKRCQEIADVLAELARQPSLWRETA